MTAADFWRSRADREEWLNTTAARLAELRPQKTLEIRTLDRETLGCRLPETTWLEHPARDLPSLPSEEFDVVIVHSLISAFSSVDDFRRVIHDTVRVLRTGGTLFLADLRKVDLLETFHTSVLNAKLANSSRVLTPAQRAATLSSQISEERELLVSPRLFEKPQPLGFGRAWTTLKQGRHWEDRVTFRFDAYLRKEAALTAVPSFRTIDFTDEGLTETAVQQILFTTHEPVVIRNIPNKRFSVMSSAYELSDRSLRARRREGIDPQHLWDLRLSPGHTLELNFNRKSAHRFDVLLRPQGFPEVHLSELRQLGIPRENGPASCRPQNAAFLSQALQ